MPETEFLRFPQIELEVRRQLQELLRSKGVFVFKTRFEYGALGTKGFKRLCPFDLAGIASTPTGEVGIFLDKKGETLFHRPIVMIDRESLITALSEMELNSLFKVVTQVQEVVDYVKVEFEALDPTFFDGFAEGPNLCVGIELEDYFLHVGGIPRASRVEIEA